MNIIFALDNQRFRVTSPSVIDPRLLELGRDQELRILGPELPIGQSSNVGSPLMPLPQFSTESNEFRAISGGHTNSNDFDSTFQELGPLADGNTISTYSIKLLSLWVARNKTLKPSKKQLNALETLSETPSAKLEEWLKEHGNSLLADETPAMNSSNALSNTAKKDEYRVRCLDTGFRYRKHKNKSNKSQEPNVYECTNGCGQAFPKYRKGDWTRHERVNYEEWACSLCCKVLTRREHLQKHMRDAHKAAGNISNRHRQYFLSAAQRPCGFCSKTLESWSAWLAHVASHFEGDVNYKSNGMLDWVECKTHQKEIAVGAISSTYPTKNLTKETVRPSQHRHLSSVRPHSPSSNIFIDYNLIDNVLFSEKGQRMPGLDSGSPSNRLSAIDLFMHDEDSTKTSTRRDTKEFMAQPSIQMDRRGAPSTPTGNPVPKKAKADFSNIYSANVATRQSHSYGEDFVSGRRAIVQRGSEVADDDDMYRLYNRSMGHGISSSSRHTTRASSSRDATRTARNTLDDDDDDDMNGLYSMFMGHSISSRNTMRVSSSRDATRTSRNTLDDDD